MRIWERDGYIIREVDFDYDLHEFEIVVDGEVKATITPDTIEDMEDIIQALNDGADPVAEGWEDGTGNTISL